MKKIFPIVLLVFIVGCTGARTTAKSTGTAIMQGSSGIIPVAVLIEANSNFSSLLYDKTKADVTTFETRAPYLLPVDSSIFIVPVRVSDPYGSRFETAYASMLKNYIMMNRFGRIAASPEEADYVLSATVTESLRTNLGTNSASIDMAITRQDNSPVFITTIKVESRSDENFFYRPSRTARPVAYLTVKAFENILADALPKAFTDNG